MTACISNAVLMTMGNNTIKPQLCMELVVVWREVWGDREWGRVRALPLMAHLCLWEVCGCLAILNSPFCPGSRCFCFHFPTSEFIFRINVYFPTEFNLLFLKLSFWLCR